MEISTLPTPGDGRILIETPSGGSYIETALTYASNFAQITGIAVDSSGNIYVTDIDNWAVYKETYSAGTYTPSTVPTSGLNYPYDIASDASGNLYISDFSNNRIVLETNNSGSYTQSVVPTANWAVPWAWQSAPATCISPIPSAKISRNFSGRQRTSVP